MTGGACEPLPFLYGSRWQEVLHGRKYDRMKQRVVRRRHGSSEVGVARLTHSSATVAEFIRLAKEPVGSDRPLHNGLCVVVLRRI